MPQKPQNNSVRHCVGKVLAAHGLRGGLLAKPFTEAPEDLLSFGVLLLEDGKTLTPTTPAKYNSRGITFRVEEAYTREMAEALKGQKLYILEKQLPAPKGREIYYKDLPGLPVHLNGEKFGAVVDVFNSGAHDILVILTETGEEILVPYVPEFISKSTPKKGEVLVLNATEEITQFLGIQTQAEEAEPAKPAPPAEKA